MSDEIPCVGAIVLDDDRRLLLIRRANPPAQGTWSLPGGRVEAEETWEAAVVRELHEETGLTGSVVRHVGEVRRDAPDTGVYVIRDFLIELSGSTEARFGDDASDVGWFSEVEVRELDTSPGLIDALGAWGVFSGRWEVEGAPQSTAKD